MDIFNQNKQLKRLVVVLTILNFFLIGFFLWKDVLHRPPSGNSRDFSDVSNVLEKELNLSPPQVEQMKSIRSAFFDKEKVLSTTIRSERDSMNVGMFNKNTSEVAMKILARNIAENEYKMELLRLQQAQELKAICTEAQQEKFEALVLEIRDYFRPNNPPPRK
jgi:LTXXQ motif family protein